MERSDFIIDKLGDEQWYVFTHRREESLYLLNSGELLSWFGQVTRIYPNLTRRDEVVFFKTEDDAEQCLQKYLRGQDLNLEERLVRCRKEKSAIEARERNLLKQIEEDITPKVRHGDVCVTDGGGIRIIIKGNGGILSAINCNGDVTIKDVKKSKNLLIEYGFKVSYNVFEKEA